MEVVIAKAHGVIAVYGLKLLGAVVIFVVGKWAARISSNFSKKMMLKSKVDETLVSFGRNLVYITLLTLVIIAAIGQLGIQTASFIAVLGAAGLAVGFALQGALSNFAAGVMLIFFRPFKMGDHVEAGGVDGTVGEIQIFSTILNTPDNKVVIIPNSLITGKNITIFPGQR